jgi:hypothetical protein
MKKASFVICAVISAFGPKVSKILIFPKENSFLKTVVCQERASSVHLIGLPFRVSVVPRGARWFNWRPKIPIRMYF